MLFSKADPADDEDGTVSDTHKEVEEDEGERDAGPVSCAESSATKQGTTPAKKVTKVCYMAPLVICAYICTAVYNERFYSF